MVIKEQIVHPKELSQIENIGRVQPVNERAHLKRPYQALNNSRSVEKDQNKRGISQQNHHKRFQKSKGVDAQPVESEELDNTVDNLNKMWDSFEEGFLFTAKRNFSTKRILSSPVKGKMNSKTRRTDLHQDTFSLSQISREIKKCIDSTQRTEWPKIF
ncbi:1229_t:CDS:2 [Gigaspora margarita]|uniref:1229_t:CDS:1 n=1 Tax=Gigaspora margarita TaxID=4874 RepID=A0ABN7V8Z5_GIGMA|nr:1229_t:CDS:2 [Gigaspora margarita]